jgi:putative nucleotidyltransferase with HDIG domain
MAQITEVYERYKITPMLQLHQLRVAAVAKQICDNLKTPVDTKTVVTACLLHDMGNIIKFDFSYNPIFFAPRGIEYWQKVQQEFIQKYGKAEHHATLEIAAELKVSQKIIDCIDSIGFSKIKGNYFGGSLEQKICNYADMRAGPSGIMSIAERMADGARRYQHRKDYVIEGKEREVIAKTLQKLENELFAKAKIKPGNIIDESIAPIIEQLRTYEI